ncbi:acetyl/propionyl/methylcrotonyl-CoA carboxylase subunit alpha [Hyphobacterium marinum]|uniref:Acetyl/propionyl/methylcrotonyl-CoA carboxylase subunit alpha n=1 Tax=Hyphobacterium marinum TaxID=3116574 RepID=A0ABU7M0L4_9PROT|nr:acetyl/propionyl/methylcrotonyl-CoA carboxylase subunit alpha [Hyphobacterium sp. Y6023]MEE2566805.1 acetyl/propionyl/methylcrotonyl-CoA carboxylase subunit alpha [Hyphobacterium sp. Y6023]
MFKTLLIANRGEIARRVMRTARRMGIRTVAVYSEADADAPHVREADEAVLIGPAPSSESYLRADKILEAARGTGADAIHPGYGFLSENAKFAEDCAKAGIVFVGPPADAIRAMGLKDRAKALIEQANVPVTPGYHGDNQDPEHLKNAADAIGYPVLIKAIAGGGGKGMRKVDREKDFLAALESCRREAQKSFGEDAVLIEKFITNPRHIEVQIFGDSRGRVVHMFERDCSLQRRHQKVIEEAPAPGMTPNVRAAMCSAAVQAAKAVGYVGAGTVEFIVDGSGKLREDGFYFMEMNTRLQVEHPVTEMVTGLDLVELQLRVAAGGSVPEQDQISLKGHAIEARLYAEDPASGFLPSIGPLDILDLPTGDPRIRVDTGVEQGGEVSLHYDPMIAKVIAYGGGRDEAIGALKGALAETHVYPVKTNGGFVIRCLDDADFASGNVSTGLIGDKLDDLLPPKFELQAALLAARAVLDAGPGHGRAGGVWSAGDGFRLNADPVRQVRFVRPGETDAIPVSLSSGTGRDITGMINGNAVAVSASLAASARLVRDDAGLTVFAGGETHRFDIPRPDAAADALQAGGLVKAPMPGKVLSVSVKDGDTVSRGDTLLVLEAMKMEHALTAPRDGVVESVSVSAGAQVGEGDALVTLAEDGEEAA